MPFRCRVIFSVQNSSDYALGVCNVRMSIRKSLVLFLFTFNYKTFIVAMCTFFPVVDLIQQIAKCDMETMQYQ